MGRKTKSMKQTFPDSIADVGYNANYLYSHIDDSAGANGCWTYRGARHKQGYGMIGGYRLATGKKIMQTVHRLLLKIKMNDELAGVDAVHTCGSMTCCNPAHLVTGDAFKIAALRTARGVTGTGKPLGHRLNRPRQQEYVHGLENIIAIYQGRMTAIEFARKRNITLTKAKKVFAEIRSGKLYTWLKDYK
jgi:hypothetical protein